MKEYQIQDVDLLIDLYEILKPWIKNHPHAALYNGVEGGCTNCASVKLQRRGFARTTTATYQRFQCMDCGKWLKGDKAIEKTTYRSI
jgi:hypothetical protein